MTPDDLESSWQRVSPPSRHGALSGVRAPGLPPTRLVWLAIDAAGIRHLLVEISDTSEPLNIEATRGLDVAIDELEVGDHPSASYIDLFCLDASLHPTFAAVTGEIIDALKSSDEDARTAVSRSLDRWRWFWSVDSSGLSRTEVIGLMGELWFLDRWLGLSEASLAAWTGPTASRHDFQTDDASIEVKATTVRGDSGATHRVQSLEQLEDPVTGQLFLFSLQVSPDALALNTLAGLVEHMTVALQDRPDAVRIFHRRLADAGYNPADADRYREPMRIVSEELYKVEQGFPRLTRDSFGSGLPGGIDDVSYSINLGTCIPWRVATSPAAGFSYLSASE